MLVMWVVGLLTLLIGVGLVLLIAVGIWCVIDLFLIPGMIADNKEQMRTRLRTEMQMMAAAQPLTAIAQPAQRPLVTAG